MLLGKMALIRFNKTNEGGSPTPENEKVEKIVAERLKQDRLKLAKEAGYGSYEEFKEAARNEKIRQETGYDPTDKDFDKVVQIIKGEVGVDDEKEALRAENERLKKEQAEAWNRQQTDLLNATYGTKFKSLDELDDDTKGLIGKGVDPTKAYLVNNPTVKPQTPPTHFTNDPQGGAGDKKVITAEELQRFREFSPELTDEEIIKQVKKLREEK